MQLDESIASLKAALLEVNNDAKCNIPPIFIDDQVLARPSFNYILALAKFFTQEKQSLGWKELLSPIDDVNDIIEYQPPSMTRKGQLAVLSRLLTVVSQISGKRFDVFVSPSRVLCGQDVLPTHDFLRALARSTKAPKEAMAEAVRYVLEEGDANLYRKGVRTRKAFTLLQAICRGWLVRRKYRLNISEKETVDGSEKTDENECYSSDKGSLCRVDGCSSFASADGIGMHLKAAMASACNPKSNLDEQVLLESYDAMLSRKAKVEDELKIAEERVKRENGKLIRMMNLGVKHKTKMHAAPSGDMPRPPRSAPSTGMRIWNNPLAPCTNIDESFVEKITNFSERQRGIKQKERRIDERESRLKQKFVKLKEKEAELKLQEERISKLGSNIQKKQMQLKEQKLQFERSKLLEPTAPAETSRPCLLCTEKNIQLRELKTKVRQRVQVLKQREAAVIGWSRQLRRREIELVQREQMIADAEQQSTNATHPSLHQDPHPEKQRKHQNENTEAIKQTPRDVSASIFPPFKEKYRKRTRSPRRGIPTPIQTNNDQNSIQVSFGECTPTIVEEAPTEECEDDLDEQKSIEGIDAGKYHIISTDVHKARQSLGIAKSKRKEAPNISERTPENLQDDSVLETRTIVSTPELKQKKRHVFTFERKAAQNSTLPSEPKSEKPSVGDRARTPSLERDQKPRQHDDWISSFDVQMKCAVNRLREFV
ncbi:hypothetical protein ACHAW5_006745 [Stephanodiscus triporus]|uniref:Uncharacterized protein n=1 Tax=Stephanodiscus triporus TaxID=2934178 RepID=A0ABD3P7Y6_9STRA